MSGECFICFMRPALYLSLLSSNFVTFGCIHMDKNLTKPFLNPSKTKRYIALVFHIILVILVITEVFSRTGFHLSIDLHKVLTSIGFTVEVAVLMNLMLINIYWMEDAGELRYFVKIFEYIQQFGRKEERQNIHKNMFISLTAWISIGFVLELCYPIFHDLQWLDYMSLVTRVMVGLSIYPYYISQSMLNICYGDFIRQILRQVEKEIELKMNKPLLTIQDQVETDFLRKLKKLRMLYMGTVDNIVSKNKRVRNLTITAMTISYLFQIFLMFLLILTITGEFELRKQHTPTFLKMLIGGCSFIYLISLSNLSEDPIKNTLSWIYQLPISSRFNASEMRELAVDVVVNAMVVTQLYHWFKKK